jgi:hypothetical protein
MIRGMKAAARSGRISAGRMLVAIACVAGVASCNPRPSAPESRAEYFVEKFIREPQAADDLRAVAQLADGQSPEDLMTDLATRTAVTYLRDRARLGATLGFHVAGLGRAKGDHMLVVVTVNEGVAVGAADEVRFEVEMQKSGQDWRVTHLHAD